MPTIAWFGFPLRSHTVPSLPVVAALVGAGAEVMFHTTDRYRAIAEAAGARVVSYPATCEQLERNKDLQAHVRGIASTADAIAPSLIESATRADLVVADASAVWGRAVARARGVALASSVTTFVFTRSMLQLIARPGWMTDDDIDVLATMGDLTIVYTSAAFQPAGQFLDDSHVFVGPLLDRRTASDGARVLPEGARPLAYVSLGTVFRNEALLERVSAQLAAAGWQVVVSLGSAAALDHRRWPPHVRAYPFVDQLAVLAHARLVVTHGGLQTVTEALAHGLPLLVIPQDVDQHVVGRRAANLGAAIVLDGSAMSDDDFAGAVARIETERPRFEQAAAAIGRTFTKATPLATAVERLLALAARRTA